MKIDVTAEYALETLVNMIAHRCRTLFAHRGVTEQIEIESLVIGAKALVEISGSWHPDDMLGQTESAKLLNKIVKAEGL